MSVHAFKNAVASNILNNLLQSTCFGNYEALFGGAVRDFISDGNYSNVKDFDIVLCDSDRVIEFKRELAKKYYVKVVTSVYYNIPEGMAKTCLLVSEKGTTNTIRLDVLYSKNGVARKPIVTETLDADVNAFYMNPRAFAGVRNYITRDQLELEEIKKRAKNASYKTFPGMDKRRRAKFDARHWHCVGEYGQSLGDLIKEKLCNNTLSEDLDEVDVKVQEKKEKGFFMNFDKEQAARIIKNGTIRTAGRLSVEAARQGTLFMLKQSGMEESAATKFLETSFGTTLVNGVFFGLMTFGPGISDNPKAAIMAEEYGTEGVSSAQVNIIMPMMAIVGPMIKQAFDSIPDSVLDKSSETSTPPVRVAENKKEKEEAQAQAEAESAVIEFAGVTRKQAV